MGLQLGEIVVVTNKSIDSYVLQFRDGLPELSPNASFNRRLDPFHTGYLSPARLCLGLNSSQTSRRGNEVGCNRRWTGAERLKT